MFFISPNGEYPRHYGDIQLANPGWNLGDPLPDGWNLVKESARPLPSNDEIVIESEPAFIGNQFVQQWQVRPMTDEEIERRDAPETAKAKLAELGFSEAEIEALTYSLGRR